LLADLSLQSRALFEELAAETGNEFSLTKRGLLMLCKTAKALDHEGHTAERAREFGLQARVLDARETAALDPGVMMDIAGAVHFPEDCHLCPGEFMRTLTRLCTTAGVTLVENAEVTEFVKQGAGLKHVITTAGEYAADEFVLCAGSWSSALARQLDLRLLMQAGKGYSLTLSHPRHLPQFCSILSEARIAVTPMAGSLRFGGTMEIAGMSERINPRRVRGIIESSLRYFPQFTTEDFEGITPWYGLRPCSPDGLPFIGRTARWNNLTIATGHAMMGLSLGPVTGKIVADELDHTKPQKDLRLLSPDRFFSSIDR
jgi:D-amino-acid dehydrogenase